MGGRCASGASSYAQRPDHSGRASQPDPQKRAGLSTMRLVPPPRPLPPRPVREPADDQRADEAVHAREGRSDLGGRPGNRTPDPVEEAQPASPAVRIGERLAAYGTPSGYPARRPCPALREPAPIIWGPAAGGMSVHAARAWGVEARRQGRTAPPHLLGPAWELGSGRGGGLALGGYRRARAVSSTGDRRLPHDQWPLDSSPPVSWRGNGMATYLKRVATPSARQLSSSA